MPKPVDELEKMRLDKWLWAARFFKTRQLAAEAISGGKVHMDEHRTKPGKEVRTGTRLRIHKGSLEWDVEVAGLCRQRRPASEAARLYAETEASIEKRRQVSEALRSKRLGAGAEPGGKRPSKRDRRMIHRFTNR
jgi:ribosome-associated heat shock protein Hsp15